MSENILSNKWSEIPYPGETSLPVGVDSDAGTWPLHFFKLDDMGHFCTLDGKKVTFSLINPSFFDFKEELKAVLDKSKELTQKEIAIAKYWGNGVPLNQLMPIAMALMNTYKLSPPRSARLLSVLNAAINDAFIITWHYKYLFDKPRPVQLKEDFKPVLNTPKFPTYPSGHSVVSATTETILGYFFQSEKKKLTALAEEASISRLYGGIHYNCDLKEGLKLGRQIGNLIISQLQNQCTGDNTCVDYNYTEFLDAPIIPTLESIQANPSSTGSNFNNANFSPLSSYKRL